MPFYSYRCGGCGHAFELLVRSGDVPACPSCGSGALDRQVSLTAPQGKSANVIGNARAQAAREGHFSNYGKAERSKL